MALTKRDIIASSIIALFSYVAAATLLPALRFTPYAFIAGAVIGITFVTYVIVATARPVAHDGIESVFPRHTYLKFTSPATWTKEMGDLNERLGYQRAEITEYTSISRAIGLLIDLIVRDFVKSWYLKIGPSNGFANSVDKALADAIIVIQNKLLSKDLVDVGVTRLLPILTHHMRDFNEAERQVRGRRLNREITESEELDMVIAARYRDGKLHSAVSLTVTKTAALQQQHLRRLAARILPEILPPDMKTSPSVLALVREIIASAVLLPVMQLLADPDMFNQLVETYGTSYLQERKTVQKLRAALDEHTSPTATSRTSQAIPRLQPGDDDRTFERFIRAIRLCNSISDARRFRREVQSLLRREATRPSNDPTFLRRLETGANLLDQKISQISTSFRKGTGLTEPHTSTPHEGVMLRKNATLREILYDASGLSYFMEFMDRINLMRYVQFWIVVDGLRGPLDVEETISGDSRVDESTRQDVSQIAELYLNTTELNISDESKAVIRDFLRSGKRANWKQFMGARTLLLSTQEGVYTEMTEKHFPLFKQSDLYYKWLSVDTSQMSNTILPIEDLNSSTESLPTNRNNAPRALKHADLRRSAVSSSNLIFTAEQSRKDTTTRRSLDDSSRAPLFAENEEEDNMEEKDDDNDDDDYDDENELQIEAMAQSTQSLDMHAGHRKQTSSSEQRQAEAAVQAALEELVDEEPGHPSTSVQGAHASRSVLSSPRPSSDVTHTENKGLNVAERQRPTLDSLGLLGMSARRTVFNSDDLFGENEKLWEDGSEQGDDNNALSKKADGSRKDGFDEIHEAAPGDLGLAELILSLNLDIEKLDAQQTVVDSLTQKAELTNNVAELRILRKSRESLGKEIRRKELQRQQYIVQESDNSLFGRASITIKSIMVGTQSDGHEFALYVIEIQRESAGDNGRSTSWAVTRRYSEFHELHKRLRTRFSFVKDLEFPRRQMVLTLQKDFLRKRRAALEKYLQTLLCSPHVCRSLEFRAFLSQQAIRPITDTSNGLNAEVNKQDLITRIYNSVTDGMEEFLGNLPVLDQLSAAGQNLISAASGYTQLNQSPVTPSFQGFSIPSSIDIDRASNAEEGEAEITAFEAPGRNSEVVTFIQPICDAFLELFQLNQANNWLRGRALVAVIQQLLGGTIERRVREAYRSLSAPEQLTRTLDMLQELLWPGGKFRSAPALRTQAQQATSRREATLVLATLLPDLAGGVVGKSNAAKAGRRVFATMNNSLMNQHLLYTLLDEIVDVIFGVRVAPRQDIT